MPDHPLPKLGKATKQLLTGRTPTMASQEDPRFSFCMHVPQAHSFDGPLLPVLVFVHGTRREIDGTLSRLQKTSEEKGFVVFCPLFPAGIIEPYDIHNYKNIAFHNIRFDHLLLSMLAQAAQLWRIDTETFFLHGFSGGGQFAHRFLYLHPGRLRGLSIGAPGSVTLPRNDVQWPKGIADVQTVFGIECDWEKIACVPSLVVVGEKDTNTGALGKDADGLVLTRVERARQLVRALKERGVQCDHATVPGVGHDGVKCLQAVITWLTDRI